MSCNQDFSDDDSSKAVVMIQDDFLNQPNLNEEGPVQNNFSLGQKSNDNKLLNDECFEKAFNEVFQKRNNDIDIWHEEDIDPPNIEENPQVEGKQFIKSYEEKKVIIKVEEKNGKYFPFTKGQGIPKTLEKIGLSANLSSSKVSLSAFHNNQIFLNSKFKTTDYYIDEKGKKKKQKKKRKFKPDDIRKKIKARLHKVIKNIVNAKLKNAGSQKLFNFLPQSFITNITIILNNQALDLTYEKLIEQNYLPTIKQKKGNPDYEKYNQNLDVLNYLKENPEICKNSEFDKIKSMKYKDILKAYFLSLEFEQSIIELNSKKEKIDYIEEYINKALTYVNFFANNKKNFDEKAKENNIENLNNIIKISYSCEDEENDDSG